jgi:hypothetical protein
VTLIDLACGSCGSRYKHGPEAEDFEARF